MSDPINIADVPEPVRSTSWGRWIFDTDRLVIRHAFSRYEVNLESCASSAQVLDRIVQIANKTWAAPEDVADLVHALDDVIGLQENLCGFGKEHVFVDVRDIVTKRRAAPPEPSNDEAS